MENHTHTHAHNTTWKILQAVEQAAFFNATDSGHKSAWKNAEWRKSKR